MPKDLRHQIETHLATFPEHIDDLKELKEEWAEWKTRTFWAIIGFISSMLAIGIWVGTMQAEMGGMHEDIATSLSHHADYERRLNMLEINNGEIRSRLTSIEVTLQEIKAAIIKLQ